MEENLILQVRIYIIMMRCKNHANHFHLPTDSSMIMADNNIMADLRAENRTCATHDSGPLSVI